MRKVFLLLLALPLLGNAYYSPGKPAGFVNDYAEMLAPAEVQALEGKLTSFEKETSNELTIVTVPDLGGDTIENFAVKLFEEWKIGKAKNDNGVLLLISRDDREARIEVGYGLEGALTDAQSFPIIDQIIVPAFREGKYYEGLSGAADAIVAATKGEYAPEPSRASGKLDQDTIWFIITAAWFALVWLGSVLARSKSWWGGGVVGGVLGIIVTIFFGFLLAGLIALALLVPIGLFLDYVVSREYQKAKQSGRMPRWWGGGGWGHGGGGFGGGFGGFGGGHSGGGGASGRW